MEKVFIFYTNFRRAKNKDILITLKILKMVFFLVIEKNIQQKLKMKIANKKKHLVYKDKYILKHQKNMLLNTK